MKRQTWTRLARSKRWEWRRLSGRSAWMMEQRLATLPDESEAIRQMRRRVGAIRAAGDSAYIEGEEYLPRIVAVCLARLRDGDA